MEPRARKTQRDKNRLIRQQMEIFRPRKRPIPQKPTWLDPMGGKERLGRLFSLGGAVGVHQQQDGGIHELMRPAVKVLPR